MKISLQNFSVCVVARLTGNSNLILQRMGMSDIAGLCAFAVLDLF